MHQGTILDNVLATQAYLAFLPRSTIIEYETDVGRPDEISLLNLDEWPDHTLKKF